MEWTPHWSPRASSDSLLHFLLSHMTVHHLHHLHYHSLHLLLLIRLDKHTTLGTTWYWVRVDLGTSWYWVRVVLGTSWCWIRVDLGTSWQSTSCLGYELTGKPTANLNIIIITSHEVDGSRPEASRASVSEK